MVAQFLAALIVAAVVVMALPRPSQQRVSARVPTPPSPRKRRQENR